MLKYDKDTFLRLSCEKGHLSGASEEMLDYCFNSMPPEKRIYLLNMMKAGKKIYTLPGGFRINKENCRGQFVTTLLHKDFMKNDFMQNVFFQMAGEAQAMNAFRGVFNELGEAYILKHWRAFIRISRDPRIVALAFICIYLLEKGPLQTLAQRLMKCKTFWTDDNVPQYETEQCSIWMLENIFEMNEGGAAKNPVPEEKQPVVFNNSGQQKLEEERKKNRELKSQLFSLETQLAESKAAEKAARTEARKVKEQCEAKLEQIKQELSGKLEDCVWSTTASLTGVDAQWIQGTYASHATTAELIKNAEKLLDEQRLRNLQYGSLETLLEDARALKKLQQSFAHAISTSISIHPGMNEMLQNVQKEYEGICQRLQKFGISEESYNASEQTLLLRLITAIRSIALDDKAPVAIGQISSFIELPQTIDLLTDNELLILRLECNKRRELWRKVTDTRRNKSSQSIPSKPEIWNLENCIRQFPNAMLIMDGYNVILRSESMSNELKQSQKSLAELRNAFVKKCRLSLTGLFAQVIIVFDGNNDICDVVDEKSDESFKVIYAKKQQDEHNADVYILDYIKKKREQNILLVTDDYGLRLEAAPNIDAVVSTMAIHNYIGK